MSRYIDADNLKKSIPLYNGEYPIMMRAVRVAIDATPTADVVKVRHGEWKDRFGNKFANRHYECSACQKPALDRAKLNSLMTAYHEQYLSPFCPHCGAKMDGERREE